MNAIGDVLREMAARRQLAGAVPGQGTTGPRALESDGGPRPDPACPHCMGQGEVVARRVKTRRPQRNLATGQDEWVEAEAIYTRACACLLRPERIVRDAAACGLGRYPLDEWTLERFVPRRASISPGMWRGITAWAASLPAGVGTARGWLFQGSTGLGKTHLLVALLNRARLAGMGALLVREVDIVTDLQATYHGDDRSEAQVMARWRQVAVLAIDDVGKAHVPGSADPQAGNAWLASRLYSILDERIVAGRPTLISTNMSDAVLQRRVGDALVDRLGLLTAVPFRGESLR